jgi:hypothetical protein
MNTQTDSMMGFSAAINEQRPLTAILVFSSLCIGSFIGLQLDQYLNFACLVRGTCYGDEGFIYSASLIHPMVFKLLFSSLVMMALALSLKIFTPFEALKSTGFVSEQNTTDIKKLGTILFALGGFFLLLSLPLMVYSISV